MSPVEYHICTIFNTMNPFIRWLQTCDFRPVTAILACCQLKCHPKWAVDYIFRLAKLKMVLSSVENVKRMLSGVPTPKCREGGPLFGKVGWLFLVLHLQCLALTFIILYMKCRYKLHDEKEPPLPNRSSTVEDKWKARGKFAWGWF